MMSRAIILMMFVFLCFIARLTFAEGDIFSPPINVETESGLVVVPLAKLTMAYSRGLLPANVSIRAKVQLPFDEQEIVSGRQPLMLGSMTSDGAAVFALSRSAANLHTLGKLKPPETADVTHGLLDADELWLTYRPSPKSSQCGLSVDIEARGIPANKSGQTKLPSAIPLKLSSRYEQIRTVNVRLDDGRVLPRNAAYILKRQAGMSRDPNWHVVEESDRNIIRRLLRLDLRDIDSIELEMREAIQQVNFRLSHSGNGKTTNVLTWNSIPKKVKMHGGKRWVRLDLARAIRQQIPEALKAGAPLDLVEMIAFVPKGAESHLVGDVPISNMKARYAAPLSAGGIDDIKLPAQIDKTGPNKFRMRIDLASLWDTKLSEIEFLRGQIVPDHAGCIDNIESAELVNLATRKVPSVLANIQDLARTFGGPFGLLHDDSDDIELPKFLARLSLVQIFNNQMSSLTVQSGGRQVLSDSGFSITSRGISPLAVSLDTVGLHLKGAGDVELSWHERVLIPAHAYLTLRAIASENTLHKARVRLRFTDGDTKTFPYTLGEAFPLYKFFGRKLAGADFLLHLQEKKGGVSVAEMGIFTVKVVKAEQALKETLIADHMLETYRVNLGGKELAPKLPKADFWRDMGKGQVWLDYGETHWGGGEAIPVLMHLNLILGKVNEWRFSYRDVTDTQLQAWLDVSSQTIPKVSSSARWLMLGLFILLATSAVILWRHGLLQQFAAAVWVSLFQLKQQLSMTYQLLGQVLWNFFVAQRQVINLVVVLLLWCVHLFCQGRCSVNPFFQEFTLALIIITSFAGLNIWRWRLQQGTSQPIKLFLGGITNPNTWLLVIVGIVVVIALAFKLNEMVSQPLIDADVKNISQLLSDNGFMNSIALLGIIILMDIQTMKGWPLLLIAFLYGIAPWLGAWIYRMTMPSARLARWLVLVLGSYAIGLTHIGQPGEKYFFTFGGIVVVVTWRIWMGCIRSKLEQRWPAVAAKVYGGAGSVYFSGALLGLAVTMLLVITRLEFLAEQVAIVVYYCLVVGTVKEIVSLRRTQSSRTDSPRQPDSPA